MLKSGTLLIIEEGEYSDRTWDGPVRLLCDYTKQQLADDFKLEWRKEDYDDWSDKPSPSDFVPWLIKTKRAEAVDNVHSWHIGSYGEFEPE
jgi:hypothetical protein